MVEWIQRERERDLRSWHYALHSVGHCAQYCTYTTIEQESRDIVHIVSLDKRQTNRNSVILEKECFIRTIDALLPEIHISEVVTDAHAEISALLSKENGRNVWLVDYEIQYMYIYISILKASLSTEPDGKYKQWGLHHALDIWYAAKNLGKKLRRVRNVLIFNEWAVSTCDLNLLHIQSWLKVLAPLRIGCLHGQKYWHPSQKESFAVIKAHFSMNTLLTIS